MPDCIFCQIIEGKLPCAKVYEDDLVISFLDINPVNTGHTLVVPKKHYVSLFDTPPDLLQACIEVSQKVARAVFKGTGASGCTTAFLLHGPVSPTHRANWKRP